MGKSPISSSGAPAKRAARLAPRGNARGADDSNGASFEVDLLQAMLAFRNGDFSTRLPIGWTG
jgi:hypothetical protein